MINYYKPDEYGQIVKTSPRFHGTITNVDLTKFADIDHLNIDKIEELQDEVILKILDVLKKKPQEWLSRASAPFPSRSVPRLRLRTPPRRWRRYRQLRQDRFRLTRRQARQ